MRGDAAQQTGFGAAAENLRSTTKWLLTAAAAAAAAIASGLQLTGLGSLTVHDWPRLAAAGTGLAAVLGSVGYVLQQTSLLLSDKWVSLAELQLEQFKQMLRASGHRRDQRRAAVIDRIYKDITTCQDELYGDVADSLADLYGRLMEANKAARLCPRSAQATEAAAQLKAAADTVVEVANYAYIRAGFSELRLRLALAGMVFAAGVVIFAYAVSPPAPSAQTVPRPAATSRPAAAAGQGGHQAKTVKEPR